MGEAKRRREQYRKPPEVCVFCGTQPATTRDHVPPRGLFIPPRPQLITVPACAVCNGGTSEIEEQFRLFVAAKDGPDTPSSVDFWRQGGLRTAKKNNKLRKGLLSGVPLWVRSPTTGKFHPSRTFKWSVTDHNRVITTITRGLYYHHYSSILDPSISIEVTYLPILDNVMKEFVMENCIRRNIGGDDRFVYGYGTTMEDPEISIWIYQFYTRHWAAAITKPEGCDLDSTAISGDPL
jgi:hypothetical protein